MSNPNPSRKGQFQKGQSGNPAGRPRGYDFRAIIESRAEKEGLSIDDAVWAVFRAMLKEAGKGDVQAAKLIIDKLCTATPIDVNVNHSGAVNNGTALTGDARREWLRRFSVMAQEELRDGDAASKN